MSTENYRNNSIIISTPISSISSSLTNNNLHMTTTPIINSDIISTIKNTGSFLLNNHQTNINCQNNQSSISSTNYNNTMPNTPITSTTIKTDVANNLTALNFINEAFSINRQHNNANNFTMIKPITMTPNFQIPELLTSKFNETSKMSVNLNEILEQMNDTKYQKMKDNIDKSGLLCPNENLVTQSRGQCYWDDCFYHNDIEDNFKKHLHECHTLSAVTLAQVELSFQKIVNLSRWLVQEQNHLYNMVRHLDSVQSTLRSHFPTQQQQPQQQQQVHNNQSCSSPNSSASSLILDTTSTPTNTTPCSLEPVSVSNSNSTNAVNVLGKLFQLSQNQTASLQDHSNTGSQPSDVILNILSAFATNNNNNNNNNNNINSSNVTQENSTPTTYNNTITVNPTNTSTNEPICTTQNDTTNNIDVQNCVEDMNGICLKQEDLSQNGSLNSSTPKTLSKSKQNKSYKRTYSQANSQINGNANSRNYYRNNPTRPGMSYVNLIKTAIQESPEQQLTLNEIYNWMQAEFMYFRIENKNWKNAVRHNLSLHKCFERKAEKKWAFNIIEYNNKKSRKIQYNDSDEGLHDMPGDYDDQDNMDSDDYPVKKEISNSDDEDDIPNLSTKIEETNEISNTNQFYNPTQTRTINNNNDYVCFMTNNTPLLQTPLETAHDLDEWSSYLHKTNNLHKFSNSEDSITNKNNQPTTVNPIDS